MILIFIFSKFLSFIFFGWILFQNLKFSKLSEILYRDTLLHAYYDFHVYFSKNFVTRVFLDKFGPKIWSFVNWLKFCTDGHCYMLVTVFMCNFSKHLSFIKFWGKFHPKICCSPYLPKFSIDIRCNSVNLEKTRVN